MAAATTAAATATAPASIESRRRGLGSIGRSGKNGKLDSVLRTRAFRASDRRALVHYDALVALVTIVANVFVNWQDQAPKRFINPAIITRKLPRVSRTNRAKGQQWNKRN